MDFEQINISEHDALRVAMMHTARAEVCSELGAARAAYLAEERRLMAQLDALQQQEDDFMRMLARDYLPTDPGAAWRFRPDLMAFEAEEQ